MRVNARPEIPSDEDGAVAIVVALVMIMVLSAAAIAVDAAYLWQNRRNLVTATDAGALAAAQEYGRGGDGCDLADTYVADNMAEAAVDACVREGDSRGGWVRVEASTTPPLLFANAFGRSTGHVEASTTAQYGIPSSVGGLRPFGLCVDSEGLLDWMSDGRPSPSGVYRVGYTKDHPDDCGGEAPGNWGILDFDGGNNSNADTRAWTLDGYPGMVSVDDEIPGNTGAFSNTLDSALSTLVANGTVFAVPLFREVEGNGSNARFTVDGFVMIRLVGFRTNGAAAQRYLDIRFVSGVVTGSCCDPDGPDTGLRIVRICAVEGSRDDCG